MSRPVLDTDRVVEEARAVGFQEAGVVARAESEHVGHLERWLAADLHGEMGYLATVGAVERRADLRRTFPDFASAVVVAHSYADDEPRARPTTRREGLSPATHAAATTTAWSPRGSRIWRAVFRPWRDARSVISATPTPAPSWSGSSR